MKFEAGQEVVIVRNLGEVMGYGKSEYYYSGNLRHVPLGTKGVVDIIERDDKIYLRFEDGNFGVNGGWYVHPDEIRTPEEQIELEKEQQKRLDSCLEGALLGGEPVVKEEDEEKQKKFEPKFNAREEFAIWVRQEFPELTAHASGGLEYVALTERKDEVMKGVEIAYDHAKKTVGGGCVMGSFRRIYRSLNRNGAKLAYHLENFVELIEGVSRNLKEHRR